MFLLKVCHLRRNYFKNWSVNCSLYCICKHSNEKKPQQKQLWTNGRQSDRWNVTYALVFSWSSSVLDIMNSHCYLDMENKTSWLPQWLHARRLSSPVGCLLVTHTLWRCRWPPSLSAWRSESVSGIYTLISNVPVWDANGKGRLGCKTRGFGQLS